MRNWIITLFMVQFFGFNVIGQVEIPERDTIDNILVLNQYQDDKGYILYLPLNCSEDEVNLVLFVHGYGALNPMVYGHWIEHLVQKGNAVLFVRYQMGIFSTSTEDFVPNTITAIRNAPKLAKESGYILDESHIDLIGHSYGGVIVANLAARYNELQLQQPRLALICEPGSGPLSGGVLDSYSNIGEDIKLAIIVGDEDHTVGQKLGVKIYETATNTKSRMLFWQYSDENGDEEIGASHYEPYSYDARFDNGIENFTVSRAERVSSLDQVDRFGYWEIFDVMQELAKTSAKTEITQDKVVQLSKLGTWSDGTDVRSMEVKFPE